MNPDIKVKTEPIALGQRDVKFTTAIRGGKGPDVSALDANPVKQYFQMLSYEELYDTLTGLILSQTTITLPFSIWMLKGYVDTVSDRRFGCVSKN